MFLASFYSTTYIASSSKITTYTTIKGSLLRSFGLSWALILLSIGMFLASFYSIVTTKKNARNNQSYSEEEED
jgi:hypothetical protein